MIIGIVPHLDKLEDLKLSVPVEASEEEGREADKVSIVLGVTGGQSIREARAKETH